MALNIKVELRTRRLAVGIPTLRSRLSLSVSRAFGMCAALHTEKCSGLHLGGRQFLMQ